MIDIPDIELLKLQYEILNVPLEDIAKSTGCPVELVEREASEGSWKQWWPEEEPFRVPDPDDPQAQDADEVFALQTEQFIDRAKRRLSVYSLAREIVMTGRYAKLEAALLQKARDIVDKISDSDADSASKMAGLLKSMLSKNPVAALQGISFGENEGGLPLVILRDLSGRQPARVN